MENDWMTAFAERQSSYGPSIDGALKKGIVSRVRRSIGVRVGSAVTFFAALTFLASSFSVPRSAFEDNPVQSSGNKVRIGGMGGDGDAPHASVDSTTAGPIPWYKLSNEQKCAVTLDSLRGRFGIRVSVPKGCRSEYVEDGGSWTVNESICGGWSWIFHPTIAINSHDRKCVYLFESVNYYDQRRIARERITGNKFPMRKEILWVFRGIKNWKTRSEKDFPADFHYKGYLTIVPAEKYGADTVYTYAPPVGRTSFCFYYPGDTLDSRMSVSKNSLEKLRESRYPVIQRYFFIKEGHITTSVLMMMTEDASAHLPRYERLLRRIVRYDPSVRYEDLSWYLTPEAAAIEKHRKDSINREAKLIEARIRRFKDSLKRAEGIR